MAATFDPNLTDAKDRIRQRIGDTDIAKPLIQDETIAAYLGQGASELAVAHQLCLDLAARFAKMGDVTLDDQMTRASHIYKHYIDLAAKIASQMKASADASMTSVMVGGLGDDRKAFQDRPLSAYNGALDPGF